MNPSEIDLNALPSVALKDRRHLPRQAGVYLVIDETNAVQYVGCSRNLRQRWTGSSHHRYREIVAMGSIRIAYCTALSVPLEKAEKSLISRFQPRLNDKLAYLDDKLTCLNPSGVIERVYVDISEHWPRDQWGNPASINSVYIALLNTPYRLTTSTLKNALSGEMESGSFENLVKLARVCSQLSGKRVEIDDILKIETMPDPSAIR